MDTLSALKIDHIRCGVIYGYETNKFFGQHVYQKLQRRIIVHCNGDIRDLTSTSKETGLLILQFHDVYDVKRYNAIFCVISIIH